jgi:transcriptional regulator with XRE-family HTH domain
MADSAALGEFLRSRRSALKPGDVGVVSYGTRRVPGLRREELAQLAGVSATYYTRLEQGQSARASEAVVDALARALGLDEDERAHLHDLARPSPARPRRPARPATARRGTVQLVNATADVPAVVLGIRNEVLAWNAMGHLLLAGHLDFDAPNRPSERPNLTRMLFLDPHHRDLHVDWHEEATRLVASLRLVAGRHADDRELAELIGELTMKSPEFASLWSQHPVANCVSGTKRLRHPEVGELTVEFEALLLADVPGQRILMYTATPGSPSEAALRLLHHRPDDAPGWYRQYQENGSTG